MAALFVAEEWDRVGNPMAALNCQLACRLAEERKIPTNCMVLRVHDAKELDKCNKVNIIIPCLDKHVENTLKDEKPKLTWLLSPETYFTQVYQLQNVQTIVGHFPVTSAATFILKKRFFPNAKVILINHGIPASLSESDLEEASKADVIYSVGRKAFKYFSTQYIPRKAYVQHKLYLPRPDKKFFDLDISFDEKQLKQVLTTTVGSQIDSEFNQILAGAIGDVVNIFHETKIELPSWRVQTNIQQNGDLIIEKLTSHSECKFIIPNVKPSFGSQDDLCTELVQSYLCIIPPDESHGMQGLESIAAGLPVLAPKGSSVGDLITELCPLYDASLLYESTRKDLYEKIKNALLDDRASATIEIAKKLKKSYHDNMAISQTNEQFFSYFMESSIDVAEPAVTRQQPAPQSETKGNKRPYVKADVSFRIEEKEVMNLDDMKEGEKREKERERKRMNPETLKKLQTASEKVFDSTVELIMSGNPQAEIKIQMLKSAFNDHKAILEEYVDESLLFILSYLSVEDMEYFWERYKSGQVEEILTGILIPPEIQAMAEEVGFAVRIVLKIDERKFNEIKKVMKGMSVPSPSVKTKHPLRVFDIWKRLVLADVPNIHYARYLMEQCRFNPVFNTFRQEEFFYPAFMSYWQQKENWFSLPQIVGTTTPKSVMYRYPVYDYWENYILDNIPNIYHARYLMEQLRFDPVFNMLTQEEFFYPAFVSYWHQKENLYSLPPTVTKATQYAIMHHFQMNRKEHDLDKDRAWSSLQEKFQEIGKVLYDNISEESIGKLYTSWFDSGIIDTELHGMVENCGDYYRFNSLFIYAYIIACYVCADIKSGGKCLDQLMEDKMFNFLQKMLPCLYFYIPGILRDHAEIAFLKEYTQRLLMKKDDVNVCLERLGYCLLESNCASELVTAVEVMVEQQTLDLSNCTSVSNQSLHAFAAVIQNTSIIKEVVIHSERERNTFSSEFKEFIDKFLSEGKTDELSIVIRDQHEFISFVKLLRALPILKCFHNKSDSAHCDIPDMQSVQVTATSTIDHVDQCFVEMLVQSLEWMPLLERLDLVKVGPVSGNILNCMANVKPKLSIAMFGLAENKLLFHDCERIVKATSSMPYLRHLDLKNNNIGSVGCAALLPIKDYMEVIIDGNGVGEGLSDILKVACDQVDVPDVRCNEIKTLANFYQLQRSLDTVTKLDTSNVPHSCFEKFCDSLSLFTNTEHLICQSNKSMTLNELELLIASLHNLKNMTHFDIKEIQVDEKFLEDFSISDDPSLSGQTLTIPFINRIFLSIQPSLTNLTIYRSNICKAFRGESIKHCLKLTDINMSNNEIQSPLKDILQTLPPTIQYCDVSNNNITDVSDVGKLLDNFQNIKHLNLRSNRFGAYGVHSLLHDITKYDMQSKIDVSHNFSYLYKYVRDQFLNMLAFPNIEKNNIMLTNKDLMFCVEMISRITTLNVEVPATLTELEKQMMFSDLRLLKAVKYVRFNEIGDKDLKDILVSLESLKNLESADFSHSGISIRGISTLLKFKCKQERNLNINVAHNLTDLSAVLPYIKDQLPSYSGVNLDSDQLLVDQLKFCEEVCEISKIKLSTTGLQNPQVRKLCSGLKHLPELRHVDLSFNDMEQYVVRTFSTELQTGTLNLESLDLSHNRIDDRGIKSLSLGLQEMSDLEHLDLSYNNITDRGAGYLGQAKISMQNVTYLDLSHNGIGDKGAQSLGEGMGKISQLRHLDLGHNRISDDGLVSLSEGLRRMLSCVLTYLDLSHNGIGDKGAQSLGEGIGTISKLEHLNLGHNRIGDHGVVSLSDGLRRMLPCVLTYLDLSHNAINESGKESLMIAMHSMNHLDLSHNNISDFGAESFKPVNVTWPNLTHLDLGNNKIGDSGAASLNNGIEKMMKLQHLNLSNNSIGDDGAASLSHGIEKIKLIHLNLSNNIIGDGGAKHLNVKMDELTHFNLSNNKIGPKGAGHLSKGIKAMHKLTNLDLSYNAIGDTGAKSFGENFSSMKDKATSYSLVHLRLSNNQIGDAGAASLSKAVERMSELKQLDLSFNQIGDSGAESLSKSIQSPSKLSSLFLGNNKIGPSGKESLTKAIKQSNRIIHLDLSHNAIQT